MLRPRSGAVGAVIAVIVAALLLADAVVRGGWVQMLLLAPWLLLIVWVVYVTAYASHVVIDDSQVTVQNFLRRVAAPWRCVRDVRMDWQVRFDLDDGRTVTAFGGPVGQRARSSGTDGARPRGSAAVADLEMIEDAWERARQRMGEPKSATPASGRIKRGWDVPAIVALAGIVVWAATALIVTGGPS